MLHGNEYAIPKRIERRSPGPSSKTLFSYEFREGQAQEMGFEEGKRSPEDFVDPSEDGK